MYLGTVRIKSSVSGGSRLWLKRAIQKDLFLQKYPQPSVFFLQMERARRALHKLVCKNSRALGVPPANRDSNGRALPPTGWHRAPPTALLLQLTLSRAAGCELKKIHLHRFSKKNPFGLISSVFLWTVFHILSCSNFFLFKFKWLFSYIWSCTSFCYFAIMKAGNDEWNRHFGGLKASKETSHSSPKFGNTMRKKIIKKKPPKPIYCFCTKILQIVIIIHCWL